MKNKIGCISFDIWWKTCLHPNYRNWFFNWYRMLHRNNFRNIKIWIVFEKTHVKITKS